jgi:hypothetical protein
VFLFYIQQLCFYSPSQNESLALLGIQALKLQDNCSERFRIRPNAERCFYRGERAYLPL